MKRLLSIILCVLLATSLCGCEQVMAEFEKGIKDLTKAFNANESIYEYGTCRLIIVDGAKLMTDAEEESLAINLKPYCSNVDCDVLICTTDTPSMSATKYGSAYISRFLPNQSEHNVSFVLDNNHREWIISWDGYLNDMLSDSYAYRAFDVGDPYLDKEQYATGFQEMVTYLLKEIDKLERQTPSR